MKNSAISYSTRHFGPVEQLDSATFLLARNFSSDADQFLADHTVDGECLFPAAMMLELMVQCGHAILPVDGAIILENFRILRPIKIPEARMLKLYAVKESGGIRMSLCADYIKSGRTIRKDIVYAESFYKTDCQEISIDRELYLDKKMKCFSLSLEDIYFSDFMQSASFFQGLGKELCLSKDRFKGIIETTESDCDYLVEPVLIDNCIQLGSIITGANKGYRVLPVSIDRLCIFEKLSGQQAYCYGRVERYEDQATVQDFIVCDQADTILLASSGTRQHYLGKFSFDVKNHLQQAHDRAIS